MSVLPRCSGASDNDFPSYPIPVSVSVICPNCNKAIPEGKRICQSCGYLIESSERDPSGLSFDDDGYRRGFDLLEKKDVDGAFREWSRCLADSDDDRALSLYGDIVEKYCDHVVANLEWEYFPVPEDLMTLSCGMSARLGPEKNLVQDLISTLAGYPVQVGDYLYESWDVAECLSNAYVVGCGGIDELAGHLEWMGDIEDQYEGRFMELEEEEYAQSARANAAFCRDAASRARKISVRDYGERDTTWLETLYVAAKEAHAKYYNSKLMADRRRRSYTEALEEFLEEFIGEPLS